MCDFRLAKCMVLIKLDAVEAAEMLEAFRMVTIDGNDACASIDAIM